MRPCREPARLVRNSDAAFNIGASIGALSLLQAGAYVCMGGRVMHHARCVRDTKSGLFLEKDDNLDMAVDAECGKVLRDVKGLFN